MPAADPRTTTIHDRRRRQSFSVAHLRRHHGRPTLMAPNQPRDPRPRRARPGDLYGWRVTRRFGCLAAAIVVALAGCRGGDDSPASDGVTPAGADAVGAACDPPRRASLSAEPRTIAVGGLERKYVVHLPPGYKGTEPAPLVFNLHGFGGDIAGQDSSTDLPALAGERGYLVVTPQGASLDVPDYLRAAASAAGFEGLAFWNFFGSDPGEVTVAGAKIPLADLGADDVAFIDTLLDKVTDEYCVDADRVFSTGMSNGAGMSTTLGCELGDRFAAIAPVSGVNLSGGCPGDDPVSVLAVHGDADPIAGYAGSSLLGFDLGNPSVPDRMAAWASLDGCEAEPAVDRSTAGLAVTRWPECADDTAVELWTLDGWGHEWPRAEAPSQPGVIDATEVILDFFDAHGRDAAG
jgi:polyhydroxybutyrate depolymerase